MINDDIFSHLTERHAAILGKTGSGKTYAAKGFAERILRRPEGDPRGRRVCVIDPTGAWHGLRASADGRRPGFPMVIFGGPHADLPLSASHGEAVAEVIGTTATPAIIDTSAMRVAERTRFFAAFAETLLRKNKGALNLFVDEAHLFAPQGRVADPQSGMMLHAANNLVSLGRSRGLRITLISQRPAKLHKDSLTQVETLVALRLIAPQDRRAVEDWISDNADEKTGRDVIRSLATLKTGEGWVWAPEIGVLERVKFPKIATFDSSQAPSGAESALVLAPIDKDAVAERLEAVAKDALANDPAKLKAELAALKVELRARMTAAPDAAALAAAEAAGRAAAEAELVPVWYRRGVEDAAAAFSKAIQSVDAAAIVAKGVADFRAVGALPATRVARAPTKSVASVPISRAVAVAKSDKPMGAERRPLSVLAAVYPAGMTEAQWAVAAGLKRSGGTWAAYVSRLRTAGRIAQEGGSFFATPTGIADLGARIEPLPAPGPELVEYWATKIAGAGPMLRYLAAVYPRAVTRANLSVDLGLAPLGGTFSAYLSRLRSPGLIEVNGQEVRAARSLMEAPRQGAAA